MCSILEIGIKELIGAINAWEMCVYQIIMTYLTAHTVLEILIPERYKEYFFSSYEMM